MKPTFIDKTNYQKIQKILNKSGNIKIEQYDGQNGIFIYTDKKEFEGLRLTKDIVVQTQFGNFTPDLDTDALNRWNTAEKTFLGCFCGKEFYTDDWIQCDECHRWCHLQCTHYKTMEIAANSDKYICQLCSNK